MTTSSSMLRIILTLVLLTGLARSDPDPLQDYCVADTRRPQTFFINGVPCMTPESADPTHFSTSALSKPGKTRDSGFNVTLTNVQNLPGMNTMGMAMARIDLAGNGLVPPHSHPRASEVTILLKGSILVGFVNTSNRLFTQQLRPGDSFVFPKGLIHFLYNMDPNAPALALSGLNSQNPGAQLAAVATFASKPAMPDEVLKAAFKIDGQEVTKIRRNLGG